MGLDCSGCPVRDRAACSVLTIDERDALARAGRARKAQAAATCCSLPATKTPPARRCSGGRSRSPASTSRAPSGILAIVHPAGFVGELFTPFAHHDVVALTDSELCVFPRSEIARAVDKHPGWRRRCCAARRKTAAEPRAARAERRRSASAKVAGLLMGLAEAASESSCHAAHEFELPLTRGEIAGMLGLTIETVSRALTKFERDGVIRRKGARGIEVVDPARLGALAEDADG
jgi:CRP/FNR family transcriptional regulator